MTAGLEPVVAASRRVLHVGLGAVLLWLPLTLPSLPPPLPCFALQGLITPPLEAEKCSVFVLVAVSVRVCSHSLVFVSHCWGKRKTETLLVISSAVSLSGPGVLLGLSRGHTSASWGRSPGGLPLGWLECFKGEGRGKAVEAKGTLHTGEDGVFSAASAVGAGCNPFSGGREQCVEWMGLCGDRV